MSVKTAAVAGGSAPTSNAALRSMRLQAALVALIGSGPLSRTQLAEVTGYSRPSMTTTVRDLIDLGYVLDSGVQQATGGRHRTLLELNRASLRFTLVSLENGHLALRQCDLTGRTTHEVRVLFEGEDALERLVLALTELDDHLDLPSRCIVLSLPGVVSSEGTVTLAPMLGRRGVVRIREELSSLGGVPVLIENDVNLLALGESTKGAAQAHKDFVFVYIGDGIGAALVLDGRPHRGATGSAGEIGFLPWGPTPVGDPEVGPFEARWSMSGLRRRAIALGVEDTERNLIAALEASSEPAAWMLLRDALEAWAHAAIVAACVVNPSLVVYGGEASKLPDWAREQLGERVRQGAPAPIEVAFADPSETAIARGAIALLEAEPHLLLSGAEAFAADSNSRGSSHNPRQ